MGVVGKDWLQPGCALAPSGWLHDLIAQASTITERLTGKFEAQATPVALVNARLEAWCEAATGGDWRELEAGTAEAGTAQQSKRFKQRLAHDGLSIDTVRPLLGAVLAQPGQPTPAWAQTLEDVLALAGSTDLPALGCVDPQAPLPFEDVLLPFVYVARRRVSNEYDVHYTALPIACQAALERQLLQVLSYIGARTLLSAFALFRVLRTRQGTEETAGDRTHYSAFVAHLLGGGMQRLFEDYPVLARMLAERSDAWVAATAEFLSRLQSEWPALNSVFRLMPHAAENTSPFINLSNLEPGLSDPHAGGRAVIALTFNTGAKLIYKPRDVGPELAYQSLVAWFNAELSEEGPSTRLKTLTVINQGTYGWVEFVAHRPCQSPEDIRHFYRRAGVLLCLFYALQGTDYHYENIIADGDQPVPVDHEMLLSPYLRQDLDKLQSDGVGDHLYLLAQQQLGQSVLGTGLLPMWEADLDGQVHDISGLSGSSPPTLALPQREREEEGGSRRLTWKHVNTDRMARIWETVKASSEAGENQPVLDGVPRSIIDTVDAISKSRLLDDFLAGFRDTYEFLLTKREVLLAADGPLAAFKDLNIRFAFRRTSLYWAILESSLAPKYMRSGVERSIQLELLTRALLESGAPTSLWPIVAAEQAALFRMDIPRFTVPADSCNLVVDERVLIENCFIAPPYRLARQHITAMSEADLEQQVAFIQAAMAEGYPHPNPLPEGEGTAPSDVFTHSLAAPPHVPPKPPPLGAGSVLFNKDEAIEEAVRLGEVLRQRALRLAEGVTWIHWDHDMRLGRYQLQPLGYDLYSGAGGIALFLAALDRYHKATPRWSELALAALHPLRHALAHPQATLNPKVLGIGAGSGLGSMIYSLVRVGQLLDETTLLEEAQRLAALITPQIIASDQAFGLKQSADIIGGAAGAILGLLALHDALRSAHNDTPASVATSLLDQATLCGQHLLAKRVASDAGTRAWPSVGGRLLTGFSHGAAGIAYALLRLYNVTQERVFLEAAQEAIAYERSVFDPKARNWPDLREPGAFMTSWCHGAPGVGLARLGGMDILDTAQVRADIEIALETTRAFGAQGLDHLCCGTLGRAELLLEASRRLTRPDLRETAQEWGAWILARAKQAGGYTLTVSASTPQWLAPGLFQGLAGIGYGLLRLADPGALPSVLLWE